MSPAVQAGRIPFEALILAVVMTLVAAPATRPAAASQAAAWPAKDEPRVLEQGHGAGDHHLRPWHQLAPGLELAVFTTAGQARIEVLRCDPARWETVALAVSAVGGQPRSARAWGEEFGLSAVINAGMFDVDRLTHTAYFRSGEHLNNPRWAPQGYRQAACFEPREPGLPLFTLVDLDRDVPDGYWDRFAIVVQNMRLVRRPGENRWLAESRPWSEACLGEDDQGRMLWIYCRQPHAMRDFIEILLELPMGLIAAQHLEGGMQAQLWVDVTGLAAAAAAGVHPQAGPPPEIIKAGQARPALPIPNVLGLRPRLSDR